MMKILAYVLLVVLAAIVADVAFRRWVNTPREITCRSDLKIDRLEELSELVSLRVQVSDVLCAETRGVRAAFLVAGDALVGVDMARARVVSQDPAAGTAKLELPEPAVLNARVDHRRTLTYDVETGFFTSARTESRVRDEAMGRAQALVEAAAGSPGNIALAKGNAAKTLRLLFRQLGWEVEVGWQEEKSLVAIP
jgi:hypothetical protein